MSEIHKFFSEKQKKGKGTVRQLVWKKTNPSPMNGQNIYLSGIENAVWFKKRGGTFNAHCKNTVFEYPCGRNKLHPTEKNHELLRELIRDHGTVDDTNKARVKVHCDIKNKDYIYGACIPCEDKENK